MCKIDILLVQGQCKPNAESSLFAEAKPVLAVVFSKSPAKVALFAHTAKQIAQNRLFCAHFGHFVQS